MYAREARQKQKQPITKKYYTPEQKLSRRMGFQLYSTDRIQEQAKYEPFQDEPPKYQEPFEDIIGEILKPPPKKHKPISEESFEDLLAQVKKK